MSTTATPQSPAPQTGRRASASLTGGSLPRFIELYVAGGALVVSLLFFLIIGFNFFGWVALAAVIYLIAITIASNVVESGRKAKDRFTTALVVLAFLVALIPLISVIITVLEKGLPVFTPEFFGTTMNNVFGKVGGQLHAIIGTLLITLATIILAVPVGLMTAIYLVEYGRGKLSRAITFFVDVMTGIPSIVAGLFAYALFAIFIGPGVRMGFAGAVALAVLMIPVVIRSSEEMLRLVPNELREASYALGVPKWLTIVKIVIPTSIAGIVTGVMLAVARVIGETAPLLLVAGFATTINWNLFNGSMTTLPVFSYQSYVSPGVPPEFGYDRAWGSALTLIILVMVLNLLARWIAKRFAPKTGGR